MTVTACGACEAYDALEAARGDAQSAISLVLGGHAIDVDGAGAPPARERLESVNFLADLVPDERVGLGAVKGVWAAWWRARPAALLRLGFALQMGQAAMYPLS